MLYHPKFPIKSCIICGFPGKFLINPLNSMLRHINLVLPCLLTWQSDPEETPAAQTRTQHHKFGPIDYAVALESPMNSEGRGATAAEDVA
jgi:hypothetical protein